MSMKPQMNADERRWKNRTGYFDLRLSAFICGFIFLALAASGCESKEGSTSASGAQKVTLQLNWKPEPQFGGFYAATDVAAKHNLEIDVVPGGVGTPTVQMVAAGNVPFGVVSADEIIIARANGADVVALFAVYQTNPQGLMTHAKRGLKSIGDVFANAGTVAMQRGLPYATFLERKFGFDKVRIVPSPGGDLSAFRGDPNFTMQCFVTSEPLAAKKAGLDVQTFLIAEAGYNPYTTVLATRGDYRQKNPHVVQAMTAAVREGLRAYLDDPAKTNAFMQQLNPNMDADTFAAGAEAQRPLIETDEAKKSGLGVMTLERWETLCKQLVELKVVEKAPPAAACFVSE
jgi:NitT/TauT family transport system substrate-binding protein